LAENGQQETVALLLYDREQPSANRERTEMANKRSKTSDDAAVLKFLRTGGSKMPADLKSQRVADVKRSLTERFEHGRGIERQGAKLWSQLQKTDGPHNQKALDGLLGIHKKLAGTKIVAPKLGAEAGGFLPGRITAKVTPPFDYAITIPNVISGNPTVSGSCNTNGQLSGSAVTASARGLNAGSWYSEMGIYFHPVTAGTLHVSSTPAFSFQWWTNSLNTSLVRSFGSAQLGIFTLDRLGNVGGGAAMAMKQWDEQMTQQIRFDFGSNPGTPLSVQMNVNPTLIYALWVSLDVHVEGIGWPGSLAGAAMSVTVPSFTYQFDIQPVLASI
jgi:hypothetical protein